MHIAGKKNLLKSQSSKNTKQGSFIGKYLFSFHGGCLKTKEIFSKLASLQYTFDV